MQQEEKKDSVGDRENNMIHRERERYTVRGEKRDRETKEI